MTPRLIGETYMKYPTEKSRQKYSYGLYECGYCTKEFESKVSNIKNKNTKSCGCQKNKQKITHGRSNSRFYETWIGMIQRCTNPNTKDYKDYGGRGITVCEEWLDVIDFVAWCESTYIEGMSLDRIDNDGNYGPNNCRWANRVTQRLNQRISTANTSGYVGVCWNISNNKYVARITVLGNKVYIGSFLTIEEAIQARDNYIIQNNLPHKLSTEYKREEA